MVSIFELPTIPRLCHFVLLTAPDEGSYATKKQLKFPTSIFSYYLEYRIAETE